MSTAILEEIRAGSYGRISKARGNADDPETTAGVRRQHEDNCALAASKTPAWPIVKEYTDNDITASGKAKRPAFEDLLHDLDTGVINRLVVWHLDRLLRIRGDLDRLAKVCKRRKVEIITVRAGDIDLKTATGRLIVGVLTEIGEYELGHGAERLVAKHEQLAREGKPNGGPRPFGFEPDRVTIRESEAVLIREAAKRVLEGESLRSIAEDWQRRGVPTTGRGDKASRWSHGRIRQILLQARIAGQREAFTPDEKGRKPRMGTIVSPAIWDAIVEVETSTRLRELLADPKRRSNPGVTHSQQLLTGLLYCGACGHRMWSAGQGLMRCEGSPEPGCGKITIRTPRLEERVVGAVLERLDSGGLEEILREGDDSAMLAELSEVQRQEEVLATRWADRELSDAVWRVANGRLSRRRVSLTDQIERARRTRGLAALPNPLTPAWATMTVPQRRTTIALVISKIDIRPAAEGGDRVQVAWKY